MALGLLVHTYSTERTKGMELKTIAVEGTIFAPVPVPMKGTGERNRLIPRR